MRDPRANRDPSRNAGRNFMRLAKARRDDRMDGRVAVRDRVAAVGAAADRDRGRPGLAREQLRRRRRARDRVEHRQLRHADAERAAEEPRPGAGRADDGARRDAAVLRDDARDAPGRGLDAAHRRAAHDARAGAPAAPRAIARVARDGSARPSLARVERAGPALAGGEHGLEFRGRAMIARVEPVLARDGEPLAERCKLRLVLRKVERAALAESDVLAELRRQLLPEPQALHHQRQLDRRAALLAHPAPVAARLLAADAAFLEHGDRHAAAARGSTPSSCR